MNVCVYVYVYVCVAAILVSFAPLLSQILHLIRLHSQPEKLSICIDSNKSHCDDGQWINQCVACLYFYKYVEIEFMKCFQWIIITWS